MPGKYHSFLKPFHMDFIRMHILALSPIFYIWLLFTIFSSTALFLATISSVLYLVSLITLFSPFSPSQQQVINQVILIPWFRCSSGFIEVRIQFTLSHSCLPFLCDCTIWPSSLWSHLPFSTMSQSQWIYPKPPVEESLHLLFSLLGRHLPSLLFPKSSPQHVCLTVIVSTFPFLTTLAKLALHPFHSNHIILFSSWNFLLPAVKWQIYCLFPYLATVG